MGLSYDKKKSICETLEYNLLMELFISGFYYIHKDIQFESRLFGKVMEKYINGIRYKKIYDMESIKTDLRILPKLGILFDVLEPYFINHIRSRKKIYGQYYFSLYMSEFLGFIIDINLLKINDRMLLFAVRNDLDVNFIKKLVNRGLNINYSEEIIYLAIMKRDYELVKLLIDNGFNFMIHRKYFDPILSPLKFAKSKGNYDKHIVELLENSEKKFKEGKKEKKKNKKKYVKIVDESSNEKHHFVELE